MSVHLEEGDRFGIYALEDGSFCLYLNGLDIYMKDTKALRRALDEIDGMIYARNNFVHEEGE